MATWTHEDTCPLLMAFPIPPCLLAHGTPTSVYGPGFALGLLLGVVCSLVLVVLEPLAYVPSFLTVYPRPRVHARVGVGMRPHPMARSPLLGQPTGVGLVRGHLQPRPVAVETLEEVLLHMPLS